MSNSRGLVAAGLLLSAVAGAAQAQVMLDGNMDALAVGSAPDNLVAAGAWGFPANYVAAGIAEPVGSPGIFSIVPTSMFTPGATGNSLRLYNPSGTAADNWHLPNIWAQTITAAPGVIIRASFNIWVEPDPAGGSIYIGGDNGGGGFSNATGDRTAQLTWEPSGVLTVTNGSGVNLPMANYTGGVWQNVVIEIDTHARNYDLYWSSGANPVGLVGSDLAFRAPNPSLSVLYDRFTYVQFGGTVPNVGSALDNIVIEVIPAPGAGLALVMGGVLAARRRR